MSLEAMILQNILCVNLNNNNLNYERPIMNSKIQKLSRYLPICQPRSAVLALISLFALQAFTTTGNAIFGSWKTVLTSKDEPGEPLVVMGTVYLPDGKTPAAGITVYVYHTDAEGYYRKGANSSSNPRIKGTMITNGEGKYEFRTIKPGAYPDGGVPAHIHYVLSGKGYAEQRDEVMFAGDPYLTTRNKESNQVRPLTRDKDGVWHCVYDLKLKRE